MPFTCTSRPLPCVPPLLIEVATGIQFHSEFVTLPSPLENFLRLLGYGMQTCPSQGHLCLVETQVGHTLCSHVLETHAQAY